MNCPTLTPDARAVALDAVRADVADSLRARGLVREALGLLGAHPAPGVFVAAARVCRRIARRRETGASNRRIMLPAARACVALARGHAPRAAAILAAREGMTPAEWTAEMVSHLECLAAAAESGR